jgi:hypothetical protein
MLEPASLEQLSEFPERNDPLLNVALAEEGGPGVLLSLARCAGLGAEAVDVIAARVARDRDASALEEELDLAAWLELERHLVAHPNAPGSVRDDLLSKRADDAFFVLSAGAHADATERGLEAAARWPGASPLHDRPWLALLMAAGRHETLLARWATHEDELLREASAWLAADRLLLEMLSRDSSRRVRRAVASNPAAQDLRSRMAESDPACEVRARALADRTAAARGGAVPTLVPIMQQGGVLAADVRQALLHAGPALDEEGALLAARHLDAGEVSTLVAQATGQDEEALLPRTVGVGAGLGLRRAAHHADAREASLTNDIVHAMTRSGAAKTRLTGKARLALFLAESLVGLRALDREQWVREIAPGTLAGDRMVFLRCVREAGISLRLPSLAALSELPASIVEASWRDPAIDDEDAVHRAGRAASPWREARELPEDELDLEPLARPLAALERAVLAAIPRTAVSPRAALAAIALESRRRRYILSAMPTWKGPLTGVRLARVLKSHAGALSAVARTGSSSPPAATGPHPAATARWTERRLSETEAAIALAVGDLTVDELLRKLGSGSIKLEEGTSLAAGIEARAAIDGRPPFAPIVEYASSLRTRSGPALALWILLENLDRPRAPALLASAIEGLTDSTSVVVPNVCEALAMLERRAPGRLENVHAQSPRGRATIASAIARAYRALGGMRDEG